MCATRGALVVATSVGLVETMKDQGYCKLNNKIMRSITQHAKNQMRSLAETPSSSTISKKLSDEKQRKAEESMRTVMFLSTWGPNT
ncbi:unnamed protein product [Trifolium pratense]|uniref:Uncharacterized protein n=1 Tax=Trifolium pratense TaxID=57577 RepID=A0ACB0KWW3_TRIPR|nr:unnamed protein product [Trifolium pratense]